MTELPLLALGPSVEIVPVRDLSASLRQELQANLEDFAVSARYTRQTTSLVDGPTAELLGEFRDPSSIDQAVSRFATRRGEEPTSVLQEAWTVLESLLRKGVLLRANDPRMKAPPALVAGDEIDRWTIIRPIRELEDTQIYLVRDTSARLGVVKMRPGSSLSDQRTIRDEAEHLRTLGGSLAPRLLSVGSFENRPYLMIEWCPGITVEEAATRWRLGHGRGGHHPALLALAQAVATAYARLHEEGILHGDVHPQNILLDANERVWLVDFTLSSRIAEGPVALTGGVPSYRAPEVARSLLAGEGALTDEQSEQFSVAALIYRLLTGHHYRDFDLEQEAQLRQTAEAEMRPFCHRDLPGWPEVEAVLERALDRRPEQRFPSLQAFSCALGSIGPQPLPERQSAAASALEEARSRLLECLAPKSDWWRDGLRSPTASVQNGAAGVALTAYRVALLEEDSEMLSLADLWIRRAKQKIGAPDAFVAADLEMTPASVGHGSPPHSESGIHAVESLIAHVLGQSQRQEASVRRFLQAMDRPCPGLDLTFGLAGKLVTSAGLLETLATGPTREDLYQTGKRTLEELWKALDKEPTLRSSSLDNLGLAHGWAGFLFATLRWQEAASGPLPRGFQSRLTQWAETAQPHGRGWRWPWYLGPTGSRSRSMPGWCNGTTGHLLLACLAAERIEPELVTLAEGAARDVWDDCCTATSLCCGLVGRAYGLLAMFRLSGDEVWRQRARTLAETACTGRFDKAPPYSLFRGELSLAVLASDLDHARASAFPFLEGEGRNLATS